MNQEAFDDLQNIPNNFIEQPFEYQSPDFIIKFLVLLCVEAKSSEKQTHPTYNGGTIEPILYVLRQKTNQTLFTKDDIIQEQQYLINQHVIEARQKDEELNDRLKRRM